jgi:hypothetical protein
MRTNPIFIYGVLIAAAALLICIRLSMIREGVPQIETAVRQELVSLASSNAALHSLTIERATRTHMVGSGIEMTGYFQFDGSYSNESWDVFVSWRKADTNSPIDKIEIGSTDRELRTLWSRK